MTRLWGELEVDTAILGGLVVVLLAIHIFMPADEMVSRLTGEGFAALLAFLRGTSVRRENTP